MIQAYIGGLYPFVDVKLSEGPISELTLFEFITLDGGKYKVTVSSFPEEAKVLLEGEVENLIEYFTQFIRIRNSEWELVLFTSKWFQINKIENGVSYLYYQGTYKINTVSGSRFTFQREYEELGCVVEFGTQYFVCVDLIDRRLVHAVTSSTEPHHYYYYKEPLPESKHFSKHISEMKILDSIYNKSGLYLRTGQSYEEEMKRYDYIKSIPMLPEAFLIIENTAYGHWS